MNPKQDWRRRIPTSAFSTTYSLLRRLNRRLAQKALVWWSRRCMLHPNWCAPLQLSHRWYDEMFEGSESYHQHYSKSVYYTLWCLIADRLAAAGISSVFDVGCGPGQMASLLMDRGIRGYLGIDFSETAVDMARLQAPAARFMQADALTTDLFESADYDAIICTEVLEHIENDLSLMSRFRPGIRCICSVPNFLCDSHVRCFANSDAVVERYGQFFRDFDVVMVPKPDVADSVFYLFDGVRNDFRA